MNESDSSKLPYVKHFQLPRDRIWNEGDRAIQHSRCRIPGLDWEWSPEKQDWIPRERK